MQAVILAAGESSRFFPFGNGKHKSCEKLLGKSIIEHTVSSLKKSGITDIAIVTDTQSHVRDALSEDAMPGVTFVRQAQAQGMGDALLQAKEHLQDVFFVLHAHHLEFHEVHDEMLRKQRKPDDVVLLTKEEENIGKFGVLRLEGENVREIIEKPTEDQRKSGALSNKRLVGIYLLNKKFITELEKTPKDHYSFEKALSSYVLENDNYYVTTDRYVASLKYAWDLLALNKYLLDKAGDAISERAEIHKTAVVTGNVIIEDGVKIMEQAVIKGPVYIGKDAVVGTGAILRDHTMIGEGAFIGAHMEVKNSIIMDKTKTHSGFIGDSVIGSGCKIAALFCTGNVRLDRASVKIKTARGVEDTGLRSLGVCMGDRAAVGIRVSTMPGVLVGRDTVIGPSTTVFRHLEQNKVYYTRFLEEVVEINTKALSSKDILADETSYEREKMVLFDIDYTLFDTDIFKKSNLVTYQLYEEAVSVLYDLHTIAHIGIFSEGEEEFQKAKLVKTKIHEHFPQEHIHIVAKKGETLPDILEKYNGKKLFYVDDRLSILRKAKEIAPDIITVWIKRGPYAINQSETEAYRPDATILSLSEVVAIVANTN